ncbi:hypothetical protein [Aquitalea pelogenes]|uniref:hypothetical protein n=1 Tax=Aquitalea pelogenes TaxID=1293573 RepID=UPI0035B19BC1
MNNELKDINKKIRFINEVLPLHELFKNKKDRHVATEIFQQKQLELILSKYRARVPLTTTVPEVVEKFRFFEDETKEVKRVVKNDELISVAIVEDGTKNKFPLSISKFIEMISKINFE